MDTINSYSSKINLINLIASRNNPKNFNNRTFKSSFKKFHKLLHKLYTFPSSEASFPLSIHNMAAGCFTRFNYVLFVGHIHYSLKLFFFSRVIRDSSAKKNAHDGRGTGKVVSRAKWMPFWVVFKLRIIYRFVFLKLRSNYSDYCDEQTWKFIMAFFFEGGCNGNWWEVIKIGLKWNLKCFKNKYWYFFLLLCVIVDHVFWRLVT